MSIPKHFLDEIDYYSKIEKQYFTAEPGELFEITNLEGHPVNIVYIWFSNNSHIFSILHMAKSYFSNHYETFSNIKNMYWFYDGKKYETKYPPDTGLFVISDWNITDSKIRKIGKIPDDLLKFLSQGVLAEQMSEIIEK